MNMPKVNLCAADRIARGVLSIVLVVYGVFWGEQIGDVLLQTVILVFAGLNLISFVIGWCPVYRLANISSCKT
jgi:hypothetical protein